MWKRHTWVFSWALGSALLLDYQGHAAVPGAFQLTGGTRLALASAAVPATLVHEGRLFDKAGAPITANQILIYKIYDAPTGGAALWSETLNVAFDDGHFRAELGITAPLGDGLLAGTPRFLGVQVGTDAEMTPREALGSVPYSRLAGDVLGDIHPKTVSVNGTTVIDTSGKWSGPPPQQIGDCKVVNGGCGTGTYNQPTFYLDRVGGNCPSDHPILNGFAFFRCGPLATVDEGLALAMTCCALQPLP
jgi:hypothetical protein